MFFLGLKSPHRKPKWPTVAQHVGGRRWGTRGKGRGRASGGGIPRGRWWAVDPTSTESAFRSPFVPPGSLTLDPALALSVSCIPSAGGKAKANLGGFYGVAPVRKKVAPYPPTEAGKGSNSSRNRCGWDGNGAWVAWLQFGPANRQLNLHRLEMYTQDTQRCRERE